ncbi:hypothetical protein OS493_037040 [Desmophyllum pertusum]|uniref:PIK-related kinase FAT domain-containing protein n=1 Tax=Desmophyllum pertusum TaxID=174260 RepID=A0A9W9ZX05_9CNID|nr:hypothetical protein OS493_037040 [Desmophyllum pertusum]
MCIYKERSMATLPPTANFPFQVRGKIFRQHLGFVQKLYIALDEPDGVAGVAASRKQKPTLHEQILDQKSSGKLCDASARYERAIQEEPGEIGTIRACYSVLLILVKSPLALIHVDGGGHSQIRVGEILECLPVLRHPGDWGSGILLESYLKLERGVGDWDVGLGRILLAAKKRFETCVALENESEFRHQLRVVRSQQMGFLSAASMESGSYQRGYEHIVRLHMLRELEEAVQRKFLVAADGADANDWESRLHISQTSFRTREPILNLRRVVLKLLPSSDELQIRTRKKLASECQGG